MVRAAMEEKEFIYTTLHKRRVGTAAAEDSFENYFRSQPAHQGQRAHQHTASPRGEPVAGGAPETAAHGRRHEE